MLPNSHIISKSTISSKDNAREIQNLQKTWKSPCTSQAVYLTCKHLARYMEISTDVLYNGTHGKVHGNCPCTFSVILRKSIRKFPCISVSVLSLQGTWKLFSGIAKTFTKISLYQCIRAALRNMNISVHLYCNVKEH